MTKIEKQLGKIKKEKRLGLMTHLVIGYPSLPKTIFLVKIMERAGVDFVELQIPFSDPIADGPAIMRACEASLESGTRMSDCFAVMKTLTKKFSIPLFFMAYYNSLFIFGVEKFIRKAKRIGCAGLIVPDIPPDEEKEEKFIHYCRKYRLHHIRVLSPASTEARIKKNVKIANGFIYLVSRFGITGARKKLDPRLGKYIKKIKKHTSLPLAVGFGLSRKEHLETLVGKAEIAVIGSAVIDVIESGSGENFSRVERFIKGLKSFSL